MKINPKLLLIQWLGYKQKMKRNINLNIMINQKHLTQSLQVNSNQSNKKVNFNLRALKLYSNKIPLKNSLNLHKL